MIKRRQSRWLRLLLVAMLLVLVAIAIFVWWASRQIALRPLLGEGEQAQAITLPPGFQINVFAEGLSNPRFMAVGPDGLLYVADRQNGRVVVLPDADGDGVADEIRPMAEDLDNPHSLVYHQGFWFVSVPTGVVRFAEDSGAWTDRTVLIDDYPTGGHNTRTVEFLPDGRMVVSVGSSCNVCEESDPRRAAIVIYEDVLGQVAAGERLFARGLRNAVGLAIHPETGDLWATNNGRDMMGDDLPPETVYIVEDGANYGWPFCHSGDIVDPQLGSADSCEGVAAPVVEMQAHTAPLGLTFYTGDSFPAEYRDDLFIALHGSWNRSTPVGYKVARLSFENGQPAAEVVDFASGWLQADDSASGRPAGVTVGSDGALYVSDDKGGFIYRISYTGD